MHITESQPVIDYFFSTARMREVPFTMLERLRKELDRQIAADGGIAVTSDLGLLIAHV